MELSEKAKKFLERNPTLIGEVCGAKFYEDPIFGDEATLLEITPKGRLCRTSWHDLPSEEEYKDTQVIDLSTPNKADVS